MRIDLPDRIRHRFPILERQTYLNSCSQGALSDAVRQAYEQYLMDWEEQGAPWDYWVEQEERARASFAGLINAEPDEVAVTTSTSAGVSALMSGLPMEGGRDKIVMSNFEFPTVGQITHAQELLGRRVEHVPEGENSTIPLEYFDKAIDEETALVAIAHVCYRNGSVIDVAGVVEIAHQRGARVLVDSYQAAGAIEIDVRSLQVDFLTAGTVKYLLGSAGLSFLYCRSDVISQIVPTQTGWFADENIFEMDIFDYSPSPTARRFQAGTPPIPNIYAGIAGIQLVREIGVGEIAEHVRALSDRLIAGADDLGARVVTPRDPARRGPMVAIATTDEHAMVGALAAEAIITSSRDSNLRVASHCYNSTDDIDALLEGLGRHRDLLA
jgi:selenocysteine lyase/cysteine desulfurase